MATFLGNLEWRFATKQFDPAAKLTNEQRAAIKKAIQFSPSGNGLQPYKIYEIRNPELRAKMREVSYGQAQVTDSDTLFVFASRNDYAQRVEEYVAAAIKADPASKEGIEAYANASLRPGAARMTPDMAKIWASRQPYIALGFGLAACAELGIDSCPMEGFDKVAAGKLLDLPAEYEALAYLAVGKRVSDPTRPKFRFPESDLFVTKE